MNQTSSYRRKTASQKTTSHPKSKPVKGKVKQTASQSITHPASQTARQSVGPVIISQLIKQLDTVGQAEEQIWQKVKKIDDKQPFCQKDKMSETHQNRHWYIVGTSLCQRRRRWHSIDPEVYFLGLTGLDVRGDDSGLPPPPLLPDADSHLRTPQTPNASDTSREDLSLSKSCKGMDPVLRPQLIN